MKLAMPSSAFGPLQTFFVRYLFEHRVAQAKPLAGRPRRVAGAVSASLRLPCGARSCGPRRELAAFASLTALKHARRVRRRVALRARATSPVLLGAPETRRVLPASGFAGTSVLCEEQLPRASVVLPRCARAALGGRVKRRGTQGAWPRAQRARHLTRRACLSRVSAASAASSRRGRVPEYRRGVEAKRRPLNPPAERSPGAPWPRRTSAERRAATGRELIVCPRQSLHASCVSRTIVET